MAVATLLSSWVPVIILLTGGICVHEALAWSFGDVGQYMVRPWCLGECCNTDIWINQTNSTGLHHALRWNLYGQHLVTNNVDGAVAGHLADPHPPKPLVLSFHGRTGTGKNYVSRMIAESIYKKGMDSRFVHMFSANRDFPHKKRLDQYKDFLREKITSSVSSCPYQLFIFDEIEDMPEGLLDSTKPFLDHNIHHGGVDFTKAIYIFLSNTASMEITDKTRMHLDSGQGRDDITLKEMEEIIEKVSFKTGGGFMESRLIDNYVISHYIPFLPLERRHVRNCIQTAYRNKGHSVRNSDALIDKVLDHLQFVPKETGIFALKGCKNVMEKVTLVLYKLRREL